VSTTQFPPEAPQQEQAPNPKAEARAAKAYAKAMRPWYKKKRYIFSLGALLLIVIAAAGSGGGTDSTGPSTSSNTTTNSTSSPTEPADTAAAPATQPENDALATEELSAAEKAPEMTSGQENALQSAQNYLDMMAFSKAGLIQQLSSSAGEGFSKADATFAANNVDADWNQEAVEAAQNYLDTMAFSKANLIQQLSSSAGDKFTPAQARFAVSKVY